MNVNESVVCDTTVKSSILKFISCGGVGSLDLDRRPWLDRPWSDELRDERLGRRPCSSPLTDREWAVLLSVFVARGRFRKSRAALDWVSRGLLRGLMLGGGGRCGGVMGLAARLPPLRRTWTPPTRLCALTTTTPSSASSQFLLLTPSGAYPNPWGGAW